MLYSEKELPIMNDQPGIPDETKQKSQVQTEQEFDNSELPEAGLPTNDISSTSFSNLLIKKLRNRKIMIAFILLGMGISGVIAYFVIRGNKQADQIADNNTQPPAASASPSTSPTTASLPTNRATPKPTDNAVVDKNNHCGTYDQKTHPPLPATGSAPLFMNLYGSGGSIYGLAGYQWDFDGDGIWDTETVSSKVTSKVSNVYKQKGQFSPKFRVVGANSSVSETCSYPFDIVVGSKPEFENDIIMVDKLNFEYTISKSDANYKFPWYREQPSDDAITIYIPAFRVSNKEKFTFAETRTSSGGTQVYVYEGGANLEPANSYEFHFAINKSQPNNTYEGSFIVTYTTENGTVINNGPTVNYKVTLAD